RGAHRQEVLDAITEDRFDRLVVVAAKGKRHHVGPLRAAQPRPEVGVKPHALGGLVELRDRELGHGGIPLELGVERGHGHALNYAAARVPSTESVGGPAAAVSVQSPKMRFTTSPSTNRPPASLLW